MAIYSWVWYKMSRYGGKLWEKVDFRQVDDNRGCLSVIESRRDIEFDIARVYYLHGLPLGAERGGHAHRDLHQIYLAPSGKFDVHLSDGNQQETIRLDRPGHGLLIRPGVWRTLDGFSSGAVCFVLASAHYSETDYIRDYSEFLRYVSEKTGDTVE